MISYELAKKLKDAGFPQKIPHDDSVCCAQEGLGCHCNEADFPTLSELIEACGEKFALMGNTDKKIYKKPQWYARSSNVFFSNGTTPEEAVANLWIALQEK